MYSIDESKIHPPPTGKEIFFPGEIRGGTSIRTRDQGGSCRSNRLGGNGFFGKPHDSGKSSLLQLTEIKGVAINKERSLHFTFFLY
ncbi:MAG: hypothetical protein N2C14_23620 [Planctomycetales bacterium]